MFSRGGYLSSSLREIAEGAGLTVPGMTNHFPTKALLLEAVLRERDVDASTHLAERTGADLLRGVLEIVIRDEADDNLTQLYAVLAAEATMTEHPAHEYFTQRYELVIDTVRRGFAEAAVAGELREGIAPDAAAQYLVALSDGLQLQRLYRVGEHTQADLMRQFLEGILR